MRFDLSVVVCCYNSASRLDSTLRHLASQQLGGVLAEIILVDNNSSDQTAAVAESLWQQMGTSLPLRVVSEKEPGLSYARKTGIAAARADIILFCDDDNWLSQDYIAAAYRQMMDDPQLTILGGIGEAVFESEKPFWFDQYKADYAVGEPVVRKIGGQLVQCAFGAGMVVRRDFFRDLDRLEFHSLLTDRKGDLLTGGGDTEYCLIGILLGKKIRVSAQLSFKHFIPAKRLQSVYLERLLYGQGYSLVLVDVYRHFLVHTNIPRDRLLFPLWLDQFLFYVKKITIKMVLSYFKKDQPAYIQHWITSRQLSGRLAALLDLKSDYKKAFVQVRQFLDKANAIKLS